MEIRSLIWTNDARKGFKLTDFEGWIIAANGVFYVATLYLANKNRPLITVVKDCSNIVMDEKIRTSVRLINFDLRSTLHVPKVPKGVHGQTAGFFAKVFGMDGSEAIVALLFDVNKNEWRVLPPDQQVVPGQIMKFDSIATGDPNIYVVGYAHSHGKAGAYHSGMDQDAVVNRPGVHLTYGHIDQPYPELACMIVSMGRVMLDFDPVVLFDSDHIMDFPDTWLRKVHLASPKPVVRLRERVASVMRFGRPKQPAEVVQQVKPTEAPVVEGGGDAQTRAQ